MPAYKDAQKGTWYAAFYYQDWKGVKKKKLKRGFPTKKEALAWERTFLLQQAADLTMTFEAFVEIYIVDKQNRLRENTWSTKEHIIRTKILPYFKEKRLCDIKPQDVIAWQNELLNYRGKNGEPYSPTYLKTLHSQFSAILNHAVRFYGLNKNAATTAGNMGSSKHQEMLFWTKEEYLKFAEVMMDKPLSYYAFEILYWCGIREGELLALTPADFDLDKGLLSITKSYQRLNGKDVITDPKTPKSVRVVQMPDFLTEEIRDYLKSLYKVKPTDRIFEVTKYYLHHEMDRGAKEAGVKRIRIHDLRHAPNGKIKKSDVSVAKNYLTEDEMKSMELIVSAYLDLAENRARRHIPMTMEDWAKRLDIYLQADDLEVLKDAGKISAQLAKMHAETEFEKYRVVQDRLYQSDFDRYLAESAE